MEQSRTLMSMLDFPFNHFISATLIRVIYCVLVFLSLLGAVLTVLFIWAGALSQGFVNFLIAIPLGLIGVGFLTLLNLFVLRIVCEGLILVFRIAENVRSIDQKTADPQVAGVSDGA